MGIFFVMNMGAEQKVNIICKARNQRIPHPEKMRYKAEVSRECNRKGEDGNWDIFYTFEIYSERRESVTEKILN